MADLGEFDITNISFGVQYRFSNLPAKQLVPYAGGGFDVLLNEVSVGSVDDVVGVHAAIGVDYFFHEAACSNCRTEGGSGP